MSNQFQYHSFDIYTCWPGKQSWYSDSLWAIVLCMLHERTCNINNTIVTQNICYICGNKMPARCNRGFYCRSYWLLNMFQALLCPSSGAQEYYAVVAACGISCCKDVESNL